MFDPLAKLQRSLCSLAQVIAHEIGHLLNMSHTYEEGEGQTGGIMDGWNWVLPDKNEAGFNEKYRKDQVCSVRTARF